MTGFYSEAGKAEDAKRNQTKHYRRQRREARGAIKEREATGTEQRSSRGEEELRASTRGRSQARDPERVKGKKRA